MQINKDKLRKMLNKFSRATMTLGVCVTLLMACTDEPTPERDEVAHYSGAVALASMLLCAITEPRDKEK